MATLTSFRKFDDPRFRARLVKVSIALASISGFALSPQLWLNEGRFFPLIKPLDNIPVLPAPADAVLIALFLGSAIAWIFFESRIIGIIVFSAILIILCQDQMRWQPWVYLYLLLLFPYLLCGNHSEKEKPILLCQQWIMAGVYVWSGLHKFNSNFIDGTFTQMLETTGIDPDKWKMLGYAIPILEVTMGLGLLFQQSRKAALCLAIVTHLAILLYLSPIVLNHNSVVYPWNVTMIILVCLLFLGTSNNAIPTIRLLPPRLFIPLIMVWLFPILNLFGYWDHYLSFSLYSNKASSFYIAIEKSEIHKIDKRLPAYFAEVPGLQGGQLIKLDKWAYAELNVPFYPEVRTFKQLSRNFCRMGIENDKLVFLEMTLADGKPQFNTFTCKDLNTR